MWSSGQPQLRSKYIVDHDHFTAEELNLPATAARISTLCFAFITFDCSGKGNFLAPDVISTFQCSELREDAGLNVGVVSRMVNY
mmetsp:Transcript_66051/g.157947  ORF Transcript_66051/g.157947 Transcript_66051/m.157947 type:complete len:84 (-) Transcript_66051:53-304(-)